MAQLQYFCTARSRRKLLTSKSRWLLLWVSKEDLSERCGFQFGGRNLESCGPWLDSPTSHVITPV